MTTREGKEEIHWKLNQESDFIDILHYTARDSNDITDISTWRRSTALKIRRRGSALNVSKEGRRKDGTWGTRELANRSLLQFEREDTKWMSEERLVGANHWRHGDTRMPSRLSILPWIRSHPSWRNSGDIRSQGWELKIRPAACEIPWKRLR